ncbi:MAG: endonuclease domain-containing protein [Elusimicrobia bacterium]|nr:endonuclease domain-containing protein [Elusimicrobiota bacterium]
MKDLRPLSRQLRRSPTDAEKLLWRHLRLKQGGVKFRRQAVIGRYIADFVCFEKKLIIEIDGGQHVERQSDDRKRTEWLKHQGFRVLRFWNYEVLKDIGAVERAIFYQLNPPPFSSPTRGEES